jgi:hypothetical protein
MDTHGSVAWKTNTIFDDDPGYDNCHIIEILSEDVTDAYIGYLRERNISYIFAGKNCIDIPLALEKLYALFDIEDLLLEGGSGKTTVETPAVLTVADGRAMIRLVINSSNYDYVLLDGEKYENQNPEGNSTFEIPALYFDAPIPIIADSIALGRSTEIEYTLTISVPQAE